MMLHSRSSSVKCGISTTCNNSEALSALSSLVHGHFAPGLPLRESSDFLGRGLMSRWRLPIWGSSQTHSE